MTGRRRPVRPAATAGGGFAAAAQRLEDVAAALTRAREALEAVALAKNALEAASRLPVTEQVEALPELEAATEAASAAVGAFEAALRTAPFAVHHPVVAQAIALADDGLAAVVELGEGIGGGDRAIADRLAIRKIPAPPSGEAPH